MEKKNYLSTGDINPKANTSPSYALNNFHIYFTEAEILEALKAHGYDVQEHWLEEEEHHHGSRFSTRSVRTLTATKNGVIQTHRSAFASLIKAKLLRP